MKTYYSYCSESLFDGSAVCTLPNSSWPQYTKVQHNGYQIMAVRVSVNNMIQQTVSTQYLKELQVKSEWKRPRHCEMDLTFRDLQKVALACMRLFILVCAHARVCVSVHAACCPPMQPLSNVICLCSTVRSASALIHCSNSIAIYYDLIWICPLEREMVQHTWLTSDERCI